MHLPIYSTIYQNSKTILILIAGWYQGSPPRSEDLAPRSEASSPPLVGGNSGFLSEEVWQNKVRKQHFFTILGPLSEASVPLSEDICRHPCLIAYINQQTMQIDLIKGLSCVPPILQPNIPCKAEFTILSVLRNKV